MECHQAGCCGIFILLGGSAYLSFVMFWLVDSHLSILTWFYLLSERKKC